MEKDNLDESRFDINEKEIDKNRLSIIKEIFSNFTLLFSDNKKYEDIKEKLVQYNAAMESMDITVGAAKAIELINLGNKYFDDIKNIGLFTPRLNKMYILNTDLIDEYIIKDIEENVICY